MMVVGGIFGEMVGGGSLTTDYLVGWLAGWLGWVGLGWDMVDGTIFSTLLLYSLHHRRISPEPRISPLMLGFQSASIKND